MNNSVQNLSLTTKYLSDELGKHANTLNDVANVMDDPSSHIPMVGLADEFQKNPENFLIPEQFRKKENGNINNNKMCYNMKKHCLSYKESDNMEEYKKCMLRYQTECQVLK